MSPESRGPPHTFREDDVSRLHPLPAMLAGLLALSFLLSPPGLSAQAPGGPGAASPTQSSVEHDRILSINPLLLVFLGYVSMDYEQRVGEATSLGVSASSFNLSDASYLSFEAKGRYYVGGRALDGLSIGMVSGYTRLEDDETGFRSGSLAIGFNVENQWLLGVDERLALTAGVGGSRLFFVEDLDSFRTVIPILRFSLGWAF